MLDVKRLRVLREVADHGSFSAAAEALAYTQSAVSQQIAALEREAGRRWSTAARAACSLTDAGRALVGHADAILAAWPTPRPSSRRSPACAAAACASSPSRARARRWPAADRRVPRAPPGGRADAEPGRARRARRAAEGRRGRHRAAHRVGLRDAATTRSSARRLIDDPMYVVTAARPPAGPSASRAPRRPADESWIMGSRPTCPDSAILLRACQAAGFEPQIAFHSDDYLAIQGFVAAGHGRLADPRPGAARGARRRRRARAAGRTPVRHIFAGDAGGWLLLARQAGDARDPVRGRAASSRRKRQTLALAV